MKNPKPIHLYRKCIDLELGRCPFTFYNQYNVMQCAIDAVTNLDFFGCIPQVTIVQYNRNELSD